MKRIGLVLHRDRDIAVTTGRRLAAQIAARGVTMVASPSDAARLKTDAVEASEGFPEGLDLVVVLGGDGTLLRAAQSAAPAGVPLLGVNLGRLGFLSELERVDLEDGLRRLLDDGFEIEERMVLEGEIQEGEDATPLWAMNDVIVAKITIGRAIKLGISIGGEPFVSWAADGVIVASPTGSTAYSFSAGGPVVSPKVDCLVVTPVAPHGLFARTVVAGPGEDVTIRVLPDPDRASLSADGGPEIALSDGAVVRLRPSDRRIKLAKLDPVPFWSLVREKFSLPFDAK